MKADYQKTIYALGGGLIEVLISPIMESCPTDNKEKAMSLLHSFYCWGHVGVVLVSTCFFKIFGIENWKILTCIWVLIPVCNSLIFLKTPIAPLGEEGEKGLTLPRLFRNKIFWILMLMMLCAGASEQSVSQWASTFCRKGAWGKQDHRRSCRADDFCNPDGQCQGLLWKVWRKDRSG